MRPKKCRYILKAPIVRFFKPRGIQMKELQIVELTEEELEAIRLVDVERCEHEKAAKLMHISRPTFSRVLNSARKNTAKALVNGWALEIKGGTNSYIGSDATIIKRGEKNA